MPPLPLGVGTTPAFSRVGGELGKGTPEFSATLPCPAQSPREGAGVGGGATAGGVITVSSRAR